MFLSLKPKIRLRFFTYEFLNSRFFVRHTISCGIKFSNILFSHQAEEVEVADDRVEEEVVELTQEEMAARQAAAAEIIARNQSNQETDDQDELNDQLTELIVTEPGQSAAWENQSMSQMSKLSTTSCRNRILTLTRQF